MFVPVGAGGRWYSMRSVLSRICATPARAVCVCAENETNGPIKYSIVPSYHSLTRTGYSESDV